MNKLRILNSEIDNINNIILVIVFDDKKSLIELFLPKLKNIGFSLIDATLNISLKKPEFREIFNNWINDLFYNLKKCNNDKEIVNNINIAIKEIVILGLEESGISREKVIGLYSELLILKYLLLQNKYSQSQIIECWVRPTPSNHDFEFPDISIEVKSIAKDNTTCKISSEYQLNSFSDKELFLAINRIETIGDSYEDSLGLLYNEIKNLLQPSLVFNFEINCANDVYFPYLGPDIMHLKYNFIFIDTDFYFVDQTLFPRINHNNLPAGISKVTYNIDISALSNFKINSI
jgi:hypothetical protein